MQAWHTPEQAVAWLRQCGARRLVGDSRAVQPGDAFVAWPGAAQDGRRFVPAALAAGAVACLVEHEGVAAWNLNDARVASVPGLKWHAGALAAVFYDQPSADVKVVAITGTNGKTSTAWWAAQWLGALGTPSVVMGTLGIGVPGQVFDATGLTTPDPVRLQAALRQWHGAGARACVIEASSIGLQEGRLNGTAVHTAVFTNFTQDHLDYHGSMAAYWQAKRALFDWPGLQAAVVNLDDPQGPLLAQELQARGPALDVWTVAINGTRDMAGNLARLRATDVRATTQGMAFRVVESTGETADIALPVVGDYNVANLLCGLAVLRAQGHALVESVAACAALTPVPGRMQSAWPDSPDELPLVLVDYAHTPDALEKALQALQPVAHTRGGRLWCVVGCGGDRDRSKRPLMAAAAEREAARVVLTSDNPRSEDPLDILLQMQAGLSEPVRAIIEPDRAEAIAQAVRQADARDVVLLAGKGHEDYQEVAGVKRPFSDLSEGRQALQARHDAAIGAVV